MEKKASLTLRKYEEAEKYLFNRTGISIHTNCFLLYHIGIDIYLYEYDSVSFFLLAFLIDDSFVKILQFCLQISVHIRSSNR